MWTITTTSDCQAFVSPVRDRSSAARSTYPDLSVVGPWSGLAKRGRGTIRLNVVEYRILQFLASRPNQVFSPHQIATAVATDSHPVPIEQLRRFIASLRNQLGFFSDYIQSVPYLGYRFKA
jgi:DNA-binding response OmpR family regulator